MSLRWQQFGESTVFPNSHGRLSEEPDSLQDIYGNSHPLPGGS